MIKESNETETKNNSIRAFARIASVAAILVFFTACGGKWIDFGGLGDDCNEKITSELKKNPADAILNSMCTQIGGGRTFGGDARCNGKKLEIYCK